MQHLIDLETFHPCHNDMTHLGHDTCSPLNHMKQVLHNNETRTSINATSKYPEAREKQASDEALSPKTRSRKDRWLKSPSRDHARKGRKTASPTRERKESKSASPPRQRNDEEQDGRKKGKEKEGQRGKSLHLLRDRETMTVNKMQEKNQKNFDFTRKSIAENTNALLRKIARISGTHPKSLEKTSTWKGHCDEPRLPTSCCSTPFEIH